MYIFVIMVSAFSFAQGPVETTDGSSPLAEHLPFNSECFFCNLPTPNNKLKLDKICGPNPMEVVCANEGSQQELERQTSQRIEDAITKARNESLSAQGYTSFSDAIKKQLTAEGIPYDEKAFPVRQGDRKGQLSKLLQGLPGYAGCDRFKSQGLGSELSNSSIPPEVLEAIRSGNFTIAGSSDVVDRTNNNSAVSEEDQQRLRQVRQSLSAIRTYVNDLRANQLQLFFANFVAKCSGAKKQGANYLNRNSSVYRKFRSDCASQTRMEQQVSDILRVRSSIEQRKEFIRRYSYIDYLEIQSTLPSTASDQSVIEKNTMDAKKLFSHYCTVGNSYEFEIAREATESIFRRTYTSKIFQDSIHNSLFTSQDMGAFNNVVEAARDSALAEAIRLNPGQSVDIKKSLSQVKALIPLPPERSLYKMEKGQLVLDSTKLNSSIEHTYLQNFFDYQLNNLRSHQAYYLGSRGIYCQHVQAHLPTMLLATKNPFFLFGFMGHEFGHHFDPSQADENRLNFKKFHDKSIKCYQSKNSVQMREEQKGEVLSDTVAAGMIGEQLKLVPQRKRASMMIEAMKPYCEMARGYEELNYFDKTVHVIPPWRVNGIYFAHPKVREALGCDDSTSGYNFKICPAE